MNIKEYKDAVQTSKRSYENAVRTLILDTLSRNLSSIGFDTESMTYAGKDLLSESQMDDATEAEIAAHDAEYDSVEDVFDAAADAVYEALFATDVDLFCAVETHHFCDNSLRMDVLFDEMDFIINITLK